MNRTIGLAVVVALAASAGASAQVLYSTGWEASPASPAWNTGNISPQNTWAAAGNAAGHQVVGSVLLGTQTITPLTGSRMHASTTFNSTAGTSARFAWVDVSPAWATRTAGNNAAIGTLDVFLPSSQSTRAAFHGALFFGNDTAGSLIGGFVVRNSDQGIFIVSPTGAFIPSGFLAPRDTWFNLNSRINFDDGAVELFSGDQYLTSAPRFDNVAITGLGDFDLFNQNAPTAGATNNSGTIFTDNYGVAAVPAPGALALLGLGGLVARRRR